MRYGTVSFPATEQAPVPMPVPPLEPGTTLRGSHPTASQWRIEAILASGGFAHTYLASGAVDGSLRVVKELAFDGVVARGADGVEMIPLPGRESDHRRWIARFIEEGRRMRSLDHPNIVKVGDSWQEHGTAYYAMDEVKAAIPLTRTRWTQIRDTWAHVRIWAEQLLGALDEVHRQGLIHGDVKPENVLVDRRGSLVLIDFGAARLVSSLSGADTTQAAYTPGYAPGELTSPRGLAAAGPWSDLYSWAMVVYGLLLPHPGPEGSPLDSWDRQELSPDPYSLAATHLALAGVPEGWARTIQECLALSPRDRPQSVEQVRDWANSSRAKSPASDPVTEGERGGRRDWMLADSHASGSTDATEGTAPPAGEPAGRLAWLRSPVPWLVAGGGMITASLLWALLR